MRKMSMPGVSYMPERFSKIVSTDPLLWLESWEKSEEVISRIQSAARLMGNQPESNQEKAPD